MKCEICGKGVDAGAMFRENEKGVEGVWRHKACGGEPADDVVRDIVEIIDSVRPAYRKVLTPEEIEMLKQGIKDKGLTND